MISESGQKSSHRCNLVEKMKGMKRLEMEELCQYCEQIKNHFSIFLLLAFI